MRVRLPIYFNSESQQQLKDLGIEDDSDFDNAVIDEVVFYGNFAMSERSPKDGKTTIYFNCENWITPLSIIEIENIIDYAK